MSRKEEKKVTGNITIEGARLIFKNFQGKADTYNKEGDRKFGVLLDDELAEQLENDGWNVKHLRPREDDPEQHSQAWLPVKIRFKPYPPVAVMVTSRGKRKLDEETIGQLDWSYITNCDLIISPYNYPATPTTSAGVAAYVKAIYATIKEDDLALKYGDIPDLEDLDEDAEEVPFD